MPRWKMNSLGAWEETEEYISPNAGTVYKAPKPTETAGDKLRKEGVGEDGGYIDSGKLAPDGTVLESKMFDIDPKKHKTQQKQKKIRNIAEQGATEGEQEAGKRKLKDQTDLPQFLQVHQDADDIIKEGITEDQERYGKTDQLIREGKLGQAAQEHPDNPDNPVNIIEDTVNTIGDTAGGYNRQRQLDIDSAAQFVDDKVTTGLESLNVPGSEFLGNRARNISGFILDTAIPTAEEGALTAALSALSGPGAPAVGGATYAALKVRKWLDIAFDSSQHILKRVANKKKLQLAVAGSAGGTFQTNTVFNAVGSGGGKNISNVTNLPPKGMSVRNNKLFKDLGFEDWEKFFVGAWDDLDDPVSRNFNAAVSNDKYSWNTFDRVRRETLPLVMEEYAGIADIKWPRKGPELHHINAIKATMPLFEGLARNERKELLRVLMREGIYAGHDPNNLMQLPHAVHKSVTKLWNDKIGKSGKLFFERDKQGLFKTARLPFEERKLLAKNYARVVKDLELTTLKMAKDYKAISKDGLSRKLDKELKTQFNIANFENFILTGQYLGDEVSPEVKQIFKSRSVKNIRKRNIPKKKELD